MKHRLIRFLLKCYPARWRTRYAEEYVALLEQLPLTPHQIADTLRGAIHAHWRNWPPPLRQSAGTITVSLAYGALAGAAAGAVYSPVRSVSNAILFDLTGNYPLKMVPLVLNARLFSLGLLGGLGGLFFGAIIGLMIGMLLASILARWTIATARRPTIVRAIVLTIVGLGWLWNAAISPHDAITALTTAAVAGQPWFSAQNATADLLNILLIGLIGLPAAWWLSIQIANWHRQTFPDITVE